MKLSQRMRQAAEGATVPGALPDADTLATAVSATVVPLNAAGPLNAPGGARATVDPLTELKRRAQDALFARLGSRLYDSSLTADQLDNLVAQELGAVIDAETAPLSPSERHRLVADLRDDVLGYGPLERYLADPTVTEIMVNAQAIYVERQGRLHPVEERFLSDGHLRKVIDKIVSEVGRRIDETSPMVDARLPDGSRVNAIIPPLAVDGPALTIRKFAKDPYQLADLVRFGTLTPALGELLSACVRGRLNVIVSGGSGAGKTTLLNVLSSFIPSHERIVTIEDAVEVQLHQDHVVRLESRPPNLEGRGQVTIRDLVRNSLRMRPDRIIVGEARGGEALDMLQAMNTGHDGSLSTVHANSPRDCVARLETMVLMAGLELPSRAIREQIASAVDLLVHVSRFSDGVRRVTHVTEVVGMEGTVVTLQDIFAFDHAAGVDREGRHLGEIQPTGIRPAFTDRLQALGLPLPAELFGPAAGAQPVFAKRGAL